MAILKFKILARLYAFEKSTILQISDATRAALTSVDYLLEELIEEGLATCNAPTYSITQAGREAYMQEARRRK